MTTTDRPPPILGTTGEPDRRRVFHGWKVVGAGSVVQVLHAGLILQAFGSYAVLLEQQFGWSKTVISTAYSFNRAESGLLGPIQGWALTRFGSRTVMRVGIVVLAIGFLLFSRIQTPAQFIGAFFVIAIGAGLSGFLTVTTETVKWFERRRSRALSLTMLGFAVGGLLTPAVVWALETFGWRTTATASAAIIFVIAFPLTSLFGHSPASVGQPIDGIEPGTLPPSRARAEGVSDVHFTAREALRTRAFWLLSFGHASALLVVGSVIAHLSLYLTSEQGFTLGQAGLVAAGLTAFQLIGMLVGGVLGDRMSKRLLCSGAMLGHMAGLLVLTVASNVALVILFTMLHGLSWGIRGPLMGALRADYFGSTSFGQIMGISSVVLMIGIVGGPLLAGVLADVTGSYQLGFTILALLAGAGLAFFALAGPPDPPVRSAPGSNDSFS
ncbi:MAG: MFS transporter [Acidimicrobiales bacterium]